MEWMTIDINIYGPFIIGIEFIIIAVFQKQKTQKLEENGIETEGVIFDFEWDNSRGSTAKYPVVRFTTKENVWVTKTSDTSSTFPNYKTGDLVPIIYDPANPENFMIKRRNAYTIINILFIAGVLSLILGVVLLARAIGIINF